MYGSPTTKELKKHSSRPVGVVEMGSQAEKTHSKAVAGGVEEDLEQDRPQNLGFQCGEINKGL